MWIKSQCGAVMVDTSVICVNNPEDDEEKGCTCEDCGETYFPENVVTVSIEGEMVVMGVYDTHERCLQVLNDIQRCFDMGIGGVYQMPEE
jgi:hypothetical protein